MGPNGAVTIWCDGEDGACAIWRQESGLTVSAARKEFRREGWRHVAGKDYCPRCARIKRVGSVLEKVC